MATHSSTLAWKIPWMEEPGRLQSMGSRRVGHDWATSLHFHTHTHRHICVCVCECMCITESLCCTSESNILQIYYVLSCFSYVQFCVAPWTVACKACLSKGFSRQEYWNGLPCPPPRALPNPGIEYMSLSLLHWLTGYLPLAPHGKLTYFNFFKNYVRENLSLKKNNPFTLQSYLLIYKNRKLTAKKHISPRDGIVSNNLQMWTDIRQSGGKRHRKVVDKKLLAAIEKRIQV